MFEENTDQELEQDFFRSLEDAELAAITVEKEINISLEKYTLSQKYFNFFKKIVDEKANFQDLQNMDYDEKKLESLFEDQNSAIFLSAKTTLQFLSNAGEKNYDKCLLLAKDYIKKHDLLANLEVFLSQESEKLSDLQKSAKEILQEVAQLSEVMSAPEERSEERSLGSDFEMPEAQWDDFIPGSGLENSEKSAAPLQKKSQKDTTEIFL